MARASDRALGLYWGAAAAVSILAAPFASQAAALAPPCPFRGLTGLPCPTCGATHVALALSRLDLTGAVGFNPLVAAAGIVFLAGGLAAGIAAALGRPLREPARYAPGVRLAFLLAVAADWIWLLAHPPSR